MRFFITGATGGQGFPAATTLLSQGHQVIALARNPDSAQARRLTTLGAQVTQGDFGDLEALKTGVKGCDGVFLLTMPNQALSEPEQAKNVLDAAHSSGGVKVIVASTVTRAEQHESFAGWSLDWLMASYFIGKTEVQKMVEESGMRWCILQPGWLMTNFFAPVSDFYWPELKTEGVLLSAFSPETDVQLTASKDVGHFAAEALTSLAAGDKEEGVQKWNKNIIRIASDEMKMDEIAAIMSSVSGKQVTAKFRTEEDVEALMNKNRLVTSQMWQRQSGTQVDIPKCRSYGIELTSFEQLLRENRDNLNEALS